jgi:uncharacterized membrane protein YfcA
LKRRAWNLIGFVIGLGAGAFGGLVGIGGGMIMIPLMVILLRFSQIQAHGTSLVAVVFTGIAGAATYAFYKSVNLSAAVMLALSAGLTVPLGARHASRLPERKLKRAFGIFLIVISIFMLMKPYLSALSVSSPSEAGGIAVLLLTGALTGFLSGMMGIGGGGVMIAVLVLLLDTGQHTAQGTALAAMVPTAIIGSWTHFRFGNVRQDALIPLVAGILIGSYLGGATAHLVPERELRVLLCLVLMWMGIRNVMTTRPAKSAPPAG